MQTKSEAAKRRELQRLLLQEKQITFDDRPVLNPRSSSDLPRASFAQNRLWFVEQMGSGHGLYNVPIVVDIDGAVDEQAMFRTFSTIVLRHEPLRTTFALHNDTVVQIIHPPSQHLRWWETTDLREIAETNIHETLERLTTEETTAPFDLENGPLARVKLVRFAEAGYRLIVTMHHIIADGWSIGVLLNEIQQLYPSFHAQREPRLEPLPVQYADYTVWQHQRISGQTRERLLSYWGKRLAGAPTLLELPADRFRPPMPTYRGSSVTVSIPGEASAAVDLLARRYDATPFMALLAAFQILLYRYNRQETILVGTPVANRGLRPTEKMIGLLLNMLVMRADLSDASSFVDTLLKTKETTLEDIAHQDLPFEQLVEALHPDRMPSTTPLVQVLFVLQNVPIGKLSIDDLQLRVLDIGSIAARWDLTLTVTQTGGSLLCRWDYSADLFEKETIQRMSDHYRRLIEDIVAHPDRPIGQLNLTDEKEKRRIENWNETLPSWAAEGGVHRLVEGQARLRPSAIALNWHDQDVSYRELNDRAEKLARVLVRRGVSVDEAVGVCISPKPEMVVALLAIFKAGAGYLPLDPTYPVDRLQYMAQDSRVRLVLTEDSWRSRIDGVAADVVCLSDLMENDAAGSADQRDVWPHNIAYVIYTSGSTGRPKGVDVTHGALTNFLRSMAHVPGLSPEDRVLCHASISFDISMLEIWGALVSGATAVLVDRETAVDGRKLSAAILEKGITFVQATPATWMLLLEAGWRTDAAVKAVSGGEALPPDLAAAIGRAGADLWNQYGPTETTVYSSTWHVVPDTPLRVGRPIAGTGIYALTETMAPCAVGEAGELYLSGVGLARGYRNRPDLTAERFLPDPLSQTPGSRMYRSGDRGRYCNDGTLQCVGRVDDQVKLRGYRIEPGEIEAVLRQHPAVAEAAVVLRPLAGGEPGLAAYIVAHDTHLLDTAEVRAWLHARLPAYMVPARILLQPALPRTPSGKIDRRALPPPAEICDTASSDSDFELPHAGIEQTIAEIWRDALALPAVGRTQQFFDLGGHSLLLMRVHEHMERVLRCEIPFVAMLQYPTVASLAGFVSQQLNSGETRP